MDGERFDRLARTMVGRGSRRRALGLLLGGGLVAGGLRPRDAAAAPCRVKVPARSWTTDQIKQIIVAAANEYGQSPSKMLAVARCESNFDWTAVGDPPGPSGPYYGLFQFLCSTFQNFTPFGDRNLFNPRVNARAAAHMWRDGFQNHWSCYCILYPRSRHCN